MRSFRSIVGRKALWMCHAEPVRGTGEHVTEATEPEPEDAELLGAVEHKGALCQADATFALTRRVIHKY